MKLYKTNTGNYLQQGNVFFLIRENWDHLINHKDLYHYLKTVAETAPPEKDISEDSFLSKGILAPLGSQEVWAAGVTYLRSRDARMEEAREAGGADCYQKVYEAERPELFFKALPQRVAAYGEQVYIRKDAYWNVPEPELTLFINALGSIQAYTIGNDMSSRDIEGENPLYLPQAKVYERSAALGPCLYVPSAPLSPDTTIELRIKRNQADVFQDQIRLSRMKRTFTELVGYLFRECTFPSGVFLMTGTGMIPPNDFTLQEKDEVFITIEGIGTLWNTVAKQPDPFIL
jgi:2-dehydro-3-deoxy-D-arabinonate dehydratase